MLKNEIHESLSEKELSLKESYNQLLKYAFADTDSFIHHFSIDVINSVIDEIKDDPEVSETTKNKFKKLLDDAKEHNKKLVEREQASPREYDEKWEKAKVDITNFVNAYNAHQKELADEKKKSNKN